MNFSNGDQWSEDGAFAGAGISEDDDRYVANIVLRHIQQRTAELYASNPTVVCQQRERMLTTIWDGDQVTLQAAQQELQQAALAEAQMAQRTGVSPTPGVPPPGVSQNTLAVLTDVQNVKDYNKALKRVANTLELLWKYEVDAQTFSFKTSMKMMIRRAVVTGVGYVKLGFQREMHMSPELTARIADDTEKLSTIQMLSNEIADGELTHDDAEAEQLRLAIQAMMQQPDTIGREGLSFDFPDSTAIIPHKKCKSLKGFLGADWVTEEYFLTPAEILKVYGVDVGQAYTAYNEAPGGQPGGQAQVPDDTSSASNSLGERRGGAGEDDRSMAVVWVIYSRTDGLVYTACDGYPDFLREPGAPDVQLDRFYPWFATVLNEGYSGDLYPRSDTFLMRDMQLELNRARQGLREHRRANRPKMAVGAGLMEPDDLNQLKTHPANAVLQLNGLQPGQKVEDLIQVIKMPPIDDELYNTDGAFEDILRVLGTDQASMGQTTDASATEASVAQASQHADLSSCLDDQDDLLTELATAAGKLLLLNVSAQTVQKVIGPGAVWPELTREDVAENLYLQVQAGSTGRPNKQQEIQNAQIIFPMLQRMPGINPEWLVRQLIKRLDDRLDLTDAFISGMPSMDALNRIQGTVATPEPTDPQNPIAAGLPPGPPQGGGGAPPGAPPPPGPPGAGPQAPPMGGAPNDPTQQGPQGAHNAPGGPPENGLLGPRTPPVPGANGLMPGQGGGPKIHPQGGVPTP